jgi:hypothetical protein
MQEHLKSIQDFQTLATAMLSAIFAVSVLGRKLRDELRKWRTPEPKSRKISTQKSR